MKTRTRWNKRDTKKSDVLPRNQIPPSRDISWPRNVAMHGRGARYLHTDDRALERRRLHIFGRERGAGWGREGGNRRCILAFHVCFHLNGNRVHNVIVFTA